IADKVLEIMERERLVEHAAELGVHLGAQLKEQLSGHPMVGDIRGSGLFWGIELVRDRAARTPYAPALNVTNRVLAAALKRDLFVYPSVGMAGPAGGNGVMITPPFVIGREEVAYIINNLRLALDEVYPTLS
ncbi:MAG: aminotransferase class III-fold pyridoxal phosphate-dependent enzyme, partial [Candidatus Binataceae bacterium]